MLTIIARPTVAPDRLDEIKAAMLDLVEATRLEDGCLRYELHQDNEHPNRFVFVETWESRELWRQHMDGAAIKAFNTRISGGIIDFELQELSEVSP